jgi:hypothetical protein
VIARYLKNRGNLARFWWTFLGLVLHLRLVPGIRAGRQV